MSEQRLENVFFRKPKKSVPTKITDFTVHVLVLEQTQNIVLLASIVHC